MSSNLLPFEKIGRTVLEKKKAKTDPKFGIEPLKRPIEELLDYGIVNINKPKGPTSHQVSAYLQKIIRVKKTGHSGTLDPAVTGVLPIATGRATRIVQNLLLAGKEYVCIMHLHDSIPEKDIKSVMRQFVGKIKQLPPVKSAVKRQWRYRKVYYIDIIEIDDKDVLFRIGCQAGTYIRKICHDIGEALGTGGHMAELIRTKAGPFKDSSMVTLQDVADAMWYYKNEGDESRLRDVVLPVEYAVDHLPKVWVFDTTVDSLCHGADLKVPGVSAIESEIQVDEPVAVMTLKNELVGTGLLKMISMDVIKNDHGVAVLIDRVFMRPGTYPRIHQ